MQTHSTAPMLRRMLWTLVAALVGLALSGCGGGSGVSPPVVPPPVAINPALEIGNATAFAAVLQPVPANADGGGSTGGTGSGAATSLTVHYQRTAADYTGWQLYTWGASASPAWPGGYDAKRSDNFGVVYEVPLAATSGPLGYIFHKADSKDHGGADQSYTLKAGANEIWRIQGDNVTYSANPSGVSAPDIKTVRVHYLRYGSDYAKWGLHLWDGSGLDKALVPSGVVIDDWANPVTFDRMSGYAATSSEVVFNIPVLNPQGDASRKSLEFIVHGLAPNQEDKDGRTANVHVDYGNLSPVNQIAQIWLVQQDSTVYTAAPDLRSSSLSQAQAVWLSRQLIQWPHVNSTGVVKLYHSATGQVVARKDAKVSGADGFIVLDAFAGSVPAAAAARFKWVSAGALFSVRTADLGSLSDLHRKQLVLVQEDAAGNVQNATMTQSAGALDDLYASAASAGDLGASVSAGTTRFRLWAPTAQRVSVFTYDSGTGNAQTVDAPPAT